MGFTSVPDKASGDVFSESMWDTYIKDNLNTGIPVLLAEETLSGTQASIDFASIAQDWSHLSLVGYLRGDTAATSASVAIRFNGDSGSNYDRQYLAGSGATATAVETFGASSAQIGECAAASASANLFSGLVIDIPHYAQPDNNKSAVSAWALKVSTSTGGMAAGRIAAFWRSSAAITQVTIFPTAGSFITGSRLSLYGMP